MIQPKLFLTTAFLAALVPTACGSAAQPHSHNRRAPPRSVHSAPAATVLPRLCQPRPPPRPQPNSPPRRRNCRPSPRRTRPPLRRSRQPSPIGWKWSAESSGDFAGTVFAMKLSPTGRILAMGGCGRGENGACSSETILRLIDVDSGQDAFRPQATRPRHPEKLAFSPDGTMLAIAGCVERPIPGRPAGRQLATHLACGRSIRPRGNVLHEFGHYISNVTSIVWSPDSSRLYTGVLYETRLDKVDNEISYYDTASGKKLGIIEPAVTNCSTLRLDMTTDGRHHGPRPPGQLRLSVLRRVVGPERPRKAALGPPRGRRPATTTSPPTASRS